MSNSQANRYILLNPEPKHFKAITDLCKRVYPFSSPWSETQLEAHYSYFHDGQLIVLDTETDKVVGVAFSLIIKWDDYSPQDNWGDFTSGGYFHNHNPKKGSTLYGAEVMVDPECRGLGLGKMLYRGRQEIAKKYKLKRIRAGARLRAYSKHAKELTPEAYTKAVVEEKLRDPTLTFQLKQGFVVLDVAKNYLFNDPESLGYAAVIEWLNPDAATQLDRKKQAKSIESFMLDLKYNIQHLPRALRRLVRKMAQLLGDIILEYEGKHFFKEMESFRQQLKKMRLKEDNNTLNKLENKLTKKKPLELYKTAHAFSLLLELINTAEVAFRTWSLRHRKSYYTLPRKVELDFIITTSATESRSVKVNSILHDLTVLMIEGLEHDFYFDKNKIKNQLRMLWNIPLATEKKPSTLREAEYVNSLIFSDYLFDFISAKHGSYDLKLSTWVGGARDRAQALNERSMLACLTSSRSNIIAIIADKLEAALHDLQNLDKQKKIRTQDKQKISKLLRGLNKLAIIQNGDGMKVGKWIDSFNTLLKSCDKFIQCHHEIIMISNTLRLFPGLVLPIDLKENTTHITKALNKKTTIIAKILSTLASISRGSDITNYARCLTISDCESAEDIKSANEVVKRYAKTKTLPIIPMFIKKEALDDAPSIMKSWLSVKSNLNQVAKHWDNTVKVMFSYSESAKTIGFIASRHYIREAMFKLEKTISQQGTKAIFLHGQGGNIERGGGSLGEQVAWWPNSAIKHPTLTIQGEMVQRMFATQEILDSKCLSISNESIVRKARRVHYKKNYVEDKFITYIENEYEKLIADKSNLAAIIKATNYDSLDLASTRNKIEVDALKPTSWLFVLAQSRIFLQTWWGVGSAWKYLSREERGEIINIYNRDPFFACMVHAVGFALAKVELSIWRRYLQARLSKKEAIKIYEQFNEEYKLAKTFVLQVTDSKTLIENKPWLRESIQLRAPYIHILNLLQIIGIKNRNKALIKETQAGIASGLLTDG